jgi:hypothetical protein
MREICRWPKVSGALLQARQRGFRDRQFWEPGAWAGVKF